MEEASPDTKSVSFLEVKKKDGPLPCESEEDISIKYTVAGEAQGSADLMYLVSGGQACFSTCSQLALPETWTLILRNLHKSKKSHYLQRQPQSEQQMCSSSKLF